MVNVLLESGGKNNYRNKYDTLYRINAVLSKT